MTAYYTRKNEQGGWTASGFYVAHGRICNPKNKLNLFPHKKPWEHESEFAGLGSFLTSMTLSFGLIISLYYCDFRVRDTDVAERFIHPPQKELLSYTFKPTPRFSGRRYRGKNWGDDKTWRAMGPYQMVAAMAILETGKEKDGSFCFECAENVIHTMINRAAYDRDTNLADHVSKTIYQPVIEPYQYKVLSWYVGRPAHKKLSEIAFKRHKGLIADKVRGATHYLVHPRVMVALYKREPCKYWNWGPFLCNGRPGANWTGYDPQTKRYSNQVFIDSDHAFLAPD